MVSHCTASEKPRIRLASGPLSRVYGGRLWTCTLPPLESIAGYGETPIAAYENWSLTWQFRPGNSCRL